MRCRFIFALLCVSTMGPAQSLVSSNTVVTENFNLLGSSATAPLPANWKMSSAGTGATSNWSTGTNVGVVTQAASSGTPTVGGRYNWGVTGGGDRALGVMGDGGYASPNAIMAYYRNTTGSTLATLTVSFQVERYRVNTDAVTVSFSSSQDGSTWTPRGGGDISSAVFAPGASSYTFLSPQTVIKTVTITGLSIPNNGDFYLRWVISTGAASQGVGLDDVSLLAGTGTPSLSATLQDQLFNDVNSNNQVNEGDGIRYKAVIKNTGTDTAKGVTYNNPTPLNTTLDPASVKTSALASDDQFSTPAGTVLSTGNVLTNDFGLPSLRVVSFGSTANAAAAAAGGTAATDNGGTVMLNANGTLTYTPPAGFSGYDRFAYIATTLPGGTLPNNDAVVTIAVGSPATAVADSYTAVGNVSINPTAAAGVLANDGGSSKTVVAVNGDATKVGVATTTTQGGSVTLHADGSFVYNPAAGYEGGDGFSYTIDNGFSAPSTVTVTITVSGMIWFITNGGAAGDGRLSTPFNSLAAFQALNNGTGNNPAAGDHIFIYENAAAYPSSSVTLLPNQKLIGQDAAASLQTITGYTVPTYSAALPANNTGGNTANLSNAGTIITLSTGGGNLVQGLTLSPSAGSALSLAGVASGNHTATDLLIAASGTANGVSLTPTSYSGSFIYTSGSITSTGSGTAFTVSGNAANVTASVNITQSGSGTLVGITNHSAGTITFQTGTLSASGGNGLQFTNADGSYQFTGTTTLNGGDAGIDIVNGSGGTFAFSANSSITSPSGTAFNVDGTATTVTASVTYSGSIMQNTAGQRLLNITTTGSGTLTFQTGTLSAGASSTGVNLNAVNGNVNFSNGVTLGTSGARMTSQALTIAGGTGTYSLGAVSIYTTGVTALSATNADGTINTTAGTIDAAGGTALMINGPAGVTTLGMTLTTVNSTGGANNVSLVNTGGTAALGTGALSGASGTTFNVNGGNTSINYAGTVAQTSAQKVITITSTTGGIISFAGAVNGTGSSTGISLTSNTGTTINFTGVITLNGTNSVFNASGGGTINLTAATNTIGSSTAPSSTAFSVTGTTIGANGVTFQKINCSGATNGILLSNTGTGSFTVTGDGSTLGSGGTIQNISLSGVSLSNAANVSLNYINLTNANTVDGGTSAGTCQNANVSTCNGAVVLNTVSNLVLNRIVINGAEEQGVVGQNVTGFAMSNSTISNAGDEAHEHGMIFLGLYGICSISNSAISGSAEANFRALNTSGTLNFTVTNSTFSSNSAIGGDGFLFDAQSTAIVRLKVTGSIFSANRDDHFNVTGANSAVVDVIFSNNTLSGGHATSVGQGIALRTGGSYAGTFTYDIDGNTINGAIPTAINTGFGSTTAAGLMQGKIRNNIIGTSGMALSGSAQGSGILAEANGTGNGTHTVSITGNTIKRAFDKGIDLLGSRDGNTILNATVTGNNVNELVDPSSRWAIRLETGSSLATETGAVCADIANNTLFAQTIIDEMSIRQRSNATVRLVGFTGAVNNDAAVITYLQARNPAGGTATVTHTLATNFLNTNPAGSACPAPAAPIVPLQ